MRKAVLALADGTFFEGSAFGARGETVGEVVFNTSMFGYQEILTDPSYVGQIVTMAYPEMGNVGANPDDEESARPHAVGMVVRALFAGAVQLALAGVARRVPRAPRASSESRGSTRASWCATCARTASQMGVISTEGISRRGARRRRRAAPRAWKGMDLATGISTKAPYEWTRDAGDVLRGDSPAAVTPAKVQRGRLSTTA